MSCLIPHKICLTNFRQFDEIVNHPILLLRGTVGKICPIERVIYLISDSLATQETEVSRRGEFKFLCNLEDNSSNSGDVDVEKSFKLNYCQHELSVNFTYRPRSNKNSAYCIQPLYIICNGHDGRFRLRNTKEFGSVTDACRLINLNLKLVQSLYAEKLRESGFGRKTFALLSPCQLFYSHLTPAEAYELDEDKLWNYFAYELLNCGLCDGGNLKFVAFIGCTKFEGSNVAESGDFSYGNIRKHLRAHAALGGGGLALFGSGYFYAWPMQFDEIQNCFKDNKRIDLSIFPDDSNYRRTFAGVFASTLGAVCHEIGHIFDLGHTRDGIMGDGFDYLNRVFTIDNLTENLPNRITNDDKNLESSSSVLTQHCRRFTQIRRQGNGNNFLTKYHEQKQSDSFYFTRNCAVILAFHKWLNEGNNSYEENENEDEELEYPEKELITFDSIEFCIQSRREPIKLIEIRKNSNSFVEKYYDFADDSEIFEFHLPSADANRLENIRHLFVITAGGTTKRVALGDDIEQEQHEEEEEEEEERQATNTD